MAENDLGKLFARIAKISGELGALQKNAKHAQGYSYFSADAVTGHINHLMAENGLVIIPSVRETNIVDTKEGVQRWHILYDFVIADSDGNSITASWSAESPMQLLTRDGKLIIDDKAMGKAHTYALKYWLIQLFKISTVDTVDTDDLDTNNQETSQSAKPSKPYKPQNQATPQDWESSLITLVTPLFKARDHAKNAINGLLQNKIIVKGQPLNEAAAAVFQNRALKEFEADEEMLQLILGKQPKDFKQSPEAFKAAWELLAKASKQVDE